MTALIRTRLSDGGRVIIPLEIRQALHIQPGDELIFAHDDTGIHILTFDLAIERARQGVRRLVAASHRGNEALKKMRRAETRKEADDL